jgi:hypothetical protein
MKNYHNIEKSAFRKGEYVGYSNGKVYRITKSNSSFGNWHAHNQDNWNDQFFAFGLQSMSEKLADRCFMVDLSRKYSSPQAVTA